MDFSTFGEAIKNARIAKGLSRNQLADKMDISPRYIAAIENSGQHPSLQIFYELVTILNISVDRFFFPEIDNEKSTQRLVVECLLDELDERELTLASELIKVIKTYR